MNIRKPVDYGTMFEALDALMASSLPQMELFRGIGKAVSERIEKGAAVAAAEYLQNTYPDASGFSPRNLRRMRDFYRAYENSPAIMGEAMKISWTLNAVIIENCDADEERLWYIRAALCFGWSKQELQTNIAEHVHENMILDTQDEQCYTDTDTASVEEKNENKDSVHLSWEICRSPMAEFVMRDMVRKAGLEDQIEIASAATSTEEIGNPVYAPVRRLLAEHGIDCSGKTARRLTNSDYDEYDLLIGMDQENLRNMHRICGGDYLDKMHLLMEYTDRQGEVADPWYTRDFQSTWRDVNDGCKGLLDQLMCSQ